MTRNKIDRHKKEKKPGRKQRCKYLLEYQFLVLNILNYEDSSVFNFPCASFTYSHKHCLTGCNGSGILVYVGFYMREINTVCRSLKNKHSTVVDVK